MPKSIWVYLEQDGKELNEVSQEILGKGKNLADKLGYELTAVCLGEKLLNQLDNIATFGPYRILVAENELLNEYSCDGFTRVLTDLIREEKPEIGLFGESAKTMEFVPRIAAKLKCPFINNCTILDVGSNGELDASRPLYGGRVYGTFSIGVGSPQLFLFKAGVLGIDKPKASKKPDLIRKEVELSKEDIRIKSLKIIKGDPEIIDITEAERIVAVGRGIGNRENLKIVHEIAGMIRASLGGTRVAVDSEWITFERQVGQTGKTVSPKLFLACGISGASHHTMGMKDSKLIAAINKDPQAPIMKLADVAIAADLDVLLPILHEKLKEYQANKTE